MKNFREFIQLKESKSFSDKEARSLGDSLHVDWSKVDFKEFLQGLSVESEHDDGGELAVVDSKKDLAKIVLTHLKEKPDYYTRLKAVEEDIAANSVGSGAIAGLKGEPVIRKTLKKRVLTR